jgi:hypothetical protein
VPGAVTQNVIAKQLELQRTALCYVIMAVSQCRGCLVSNVGTCEAAVALCLNIEQHVRLRS